MVDGVEALKMMVDGVVAWERSGLPAGYKLCKYLENTGKQYINTGIIVNPSTDESRLDYMNLKKLGESFQVPLGNATLDVKGNLTLGWYFYIGQKSNFAFLNGKMATNVTVTDYTIDYGRRAKIVLSSQFGSVDSEIFNAPTDNKTSDNPLTIFKRNVGKEGASTEAYAHGRVFSFSHTRSGKVMINLVPCLDNTGIPCMYDTVSKQPFYNQGTGTFGYELADGSGLPDAYRRCKYLESSGTQWINTMVYDSNPNLELYAEFKLIRKYSSTSYDYVFGAWTNDKHRNTVLMQAGTNYYSWVFNKYNVTIRTNVTFGEIHRIKTKVGETNFNGKILKYSSEGTTRQPLHIFLFKRNGNPAQTNCIIGMIYDFWINDSGKRILNFVPAIDQYGKPCMYDTITKQPFYNQGSGEFGYELMDGTYVAPA